MMANKNEILSWLDKNQVKYELVEHQPLFTMEEIDAEPLLHGRTVGKNLFLRDGKGKRHFLVFIKEEKQADLGTLGEKIGARLSFASEERLQKYLNLTPGSVSPLAVYYDKFTTSISQIYKIFM